MAKETKPAVFEKNAAYILQAGTSVFVKTADIDISPGNLDSSLCFFQPSISHDVLCI